MEQPLANYGDSIKALFYTMDRYEVCRARLDSYIKFDKEKK